MILIVKFGIFSILYYFDIISKGLQGRCKTYQARKHEYASFMKLEDIEDSRPSGYVVRMPFYALATRNAHIIFTQTSNVTADFSKEKVYEFGK